MGTWRSMEHYVIPAGTEFKLNTQGYYDVNYPDKAIHILKVNVVGTTIAGHKIQPIGHYSPYKIKPSIKIGLTDYSVIWIRSM